MASYRFTPDAVADLDSIWHFIAGDNLEAADLVEKAILAACGSLSRSPLMGDIRAELTKLPVRFWTVPSYPNYVIVYRPDPRPLQIVRLLHAKRNIKTVLRRQKI
jgi:plasmid stabilization system protein ParE